MDVTTSRADRSDAERARLSAEVFEALARMVELRIWLGLTARALEGLPTET